MKSVTADGSLRSPTGGVEESYPTPHIHEQMTTSSYGYDNIMLEPNAMNNIDTAERRAVTRRKKGETLSYRAEDRRMFSAEDKWVLFKKRRL